MVECDARLDLENCADCPNWFKSVDCAGRQQCQRFWRKRARNPPCNAASSRLRPEAMRWRSDTPRHFCGLAASSSSLSARSLRSFVRLHRLSFPATAASDNSVGVALGQQEPAFAASVSFWVCRVLSSAVQLGLAHVAVMCHIQRLSRRLLISPLSGHNRLLVATGSGEAPAPAPQQRR